MKNSSTKDVCGLSVEMLPACMVAVALTYRVYVHTAPAAVPRLMNSDVGDNQ